MCRLRAALWALSLAAMACWASVEHFTQHDPLFVPPEAPAVTGKWLAERRSERAVIATRELYTGLEWYRIGDALNIHDVSVLNDMEARFPGSLAAELAAEQRSFLAATGALSPRNFSMLHSIVARRLAKEDASSARVEHQQGVAEADKGSPAVLIVHVRVGDVLCTDVNGDPMVLIAPGSAGEPAEDVFGRRGAALAAEQRRKERTYAKLGNAEWWAAVARAARAARVGRAVVLAGAHHAACLSRSARYVLSRADFLQAATGVSSVDLRLGQPPDEDIMSLARSARNGSVLFASTGGGYGRILSETARALGAVVLSNGRLSPNALEWRPATAAAAILNSLVPGVL